MRKRKESSCILFYFIQPLSAYDEVSSNQHRVKRLSLTTNSCLFVIRYLEARCDVGLTKKLEKILAINKIIRANRSSHTTC